MVIDDFIVILYGFCFFVCLPITSTQIVPSVWGYGWTVSTGVLAGLDTKLLALGHLFS